VAIVEPWSGGDGGRALDLISNGHPEPWLPGGPPARLGRRARWIATALAGIVVLSGVIWFADRQVGRSEFTAVLRCVQTSERTIDGIDNDLTVTANYVAPQVGPQSSLLIRDDLYRLIEDAAEDAAPNLEEALAGCDGVAIAPLYHRLGAARTAYVGYLVGELSHLHDISRDGTAQFRPAPELAPLLASARIALSAAAPDGGDRRQVDALLAAG
jgi:hypothetical protein